MDGMRKEFVKRTGKSFQSCRKGNDDEDNEETVKVSFYKMVYPSAYPNPGRHSGRPAATLLIFPSLRSALSIVAPDSNSVPSRGIYNYTTHISKTIPLDTVRYE